MGMIFRIAIIGCGLIGPKRAKAISALPLHATFIACVDTQLSRAKQLAAAFENCTAYDNFMTMLDNEKPDMVIVATTHKALPEIGAELIHRKIPTFLEKPGGRNTTEVQALLTLASEKNVPVHIGFNHRYHPALQKAKALIEQGELGELMFIRGRYGHGARIGFEKEWRMDPDLAGGGELIDQGLHLIDLSRWFLGDFTKVEGSAHTYYWDIATEDNGFMLLETAKKQVAFLQVSCTEWKNLFSFEIYGKKGKLHINGLGNSYGVESIAHYKMLPEMGPPETIVYEYPMADCSWETELLAFINDIQDNTKHSFNLNDSIQALKIVEIIYQKRAQSILQ